jgi:hypothetical protein
MPRNEVREARGNPDHGHIEPFPGDPRGEQKRPVTGPFNALFDPVTSQNNVSNDKIVIIFNIDRAGESIKKTPLTLSVKRDLEPYGSTKHKRQELISCLSFFRRSLF